MNFDERPLFQDSDDCFTPLPWHRTAMEWRRLIGSPYCDLLATQKHVLTVMCRYGKRHGEDIFPTQRAIAFRAGVCLDTVNQTMQRAEREGWIIRHMVGNGQGYKRTVYQLAMPAGIPDATACMRARFFDPPYKHKMVRHEDRVELVPLAETC